MERNDLTGLAGLEVLVAPAVLGLSIAVLLVGGLFGWNPLWPTADMTVSEAIVLTDRATALYLIEHGRDPNRRYHVREGFLRETPAELTPLEAAVSTRETYMVEFLLDRGAVVNETNRRVLVCCAREHDAPAVAAVLAGGDPQAIDCRGVPFPW